MSSQRLAQRCQAVLKGVMGKCHFVLLEDYSEQEFMEFGGVVVLFLCVCFNFCNQLEMLICFWFWFGKGGATDESQGLTLAKHARYH